MPRRATMPPMHWLRNVVKKAAVFSLWYYFVILVAGVILVLVLNHDNPTRQMQLFTYFFFVRMRNWFALEGLGIIFAFSFLFIAVADGVVNRPMRVKFAEIFDQRASWLLNGTRHRAKNARQLGRVSYTGMDLADALFDSLLWPWRDPGLFYAMQTMDRTLKQAEGAFENSRVSELMAVRAVNRFEYEAERFVSLLCRLLRIVNLQNDIGIAEDSFVRLENELGSDVKRQVVQLREKTGFHELRRKTFPEQ